MKKLKKSIESKKNEIDYYENQIKTSPNNLKDLYHYVINQIKTEIDILNTKLEEKKQQKIKLWKNINKSSKELLTLNLMQIYNSQIDFNGNILYKVKNAVKSQTINNLKKDVYTNLKSKLSLN